MNSKDKLPKNHILISSFEENGKVHKLYISDKNKYIKIDKEIYKISKKEYKDFFKLSTESNKNILKKRKKEQKAIITKLKDYQYNAEFEFKQNLIIYTFQTNLSRNRFFETNLSQMATKIEKITNYKTFFIEQNNRYDPMVFQINLDKKINKELETEKCITWNTRIRTCDFEYSYNKLFLLPLRELLLNNKSIKGLERKNEFIYFNNKKIAKVIKFEEVVWDYFNDGRETEGVDFNISLYISREELDNIMKDIFKLNFPSYEIKMKNYSDYNESIHIFKDEKVWGLRDGIWESPKLYSKEILSIKERKKLNCFLLNMEENQVSLEIKDIENRLLLDINNYKISNLKKEVIFSKEEELKYYGFNIGKEVIIKNKNLQGKIVNFDIAYDNQNEYYVYVESEDNTYVLSKEEIE